MVARCMKPTCSNTRQNLGQTSERLASGHRHLPEAVAGAAVFLRSHLLTSASVMEALSLHFNPNNSILSSADMIETNQGLAAWHLPILYTVILSSL